MTQHHFFDFCDRRRLNDLSVFQIFAHLTKNPWISAGGSSDHHAITSGLFDHVRSIFCTGDIPVSDHRNGNGFFDLADDVPVCFSGIILFSRSSMYGNRCCPGCLKNLCHLYGIDTGLLKSFADLYRYRLFYCPGNPLHDLSRQFRILHQCGTFAVIDYFRHRTAHIDIENIKRPLFNLGGGLCHDLRIGTEDLQSDRIFSLCDLHQIQRIFIMKGNRFRTDHFHTQKPNSLFFAQQPERQVRNARHRCQHTRICNLHISYLKLHRNRIPHPKILRDKTFPVLPSVLVSHSEVF